MAEMIPADSLKLGWKSRTLEEFVLCTACGFYRGVEQEHCSTNGCSENPETHKRKRKKANS